MFFSAAFPVLRRVFFGREVRKNQPDYAAAFSRGIEVKRAAADGAMTLKRALALCESGKYLVLEVHAGGERIFEAEEKELYGAVSGENLYKTLSEIFIKRKKRKKKLL